MKCNEELEMMGCEGPTKTVRSVACDGALSRCDCELLIEVVVEDLKVRLLDKRLLDKLDEHVHNE